MNYVHTQNTLYSSIHRCTVHIHIYIHIYIHCTYKYTDTYIPVFLISSYGAVNYDYIVTNSINPLLTGSRFIPNGTH